MRLCGANRISGADQPQLKKYCDKLLPTKVQAVAIRWYPKKTMVVVVGKYNQQPKAVQRSARTPPLPRGVRRYSTTSAATNKRFREPMQQYTLRLAFEPFDRTSLRPDEDARPLER